jgi:hypothetical protein
MLLIALEEITVKKTLAILGLSLACALRPAAAQDYPSRDIRSICNFAPGSGADIIVRFYSDKLADGQTGDRRQQAGREQRIATADLARAGRQTRDHDHPGELDHRLGAPLQRLPFGTAKDFAR